MVKKNLLREEEKLLETSLPYIRSFIEDLGSFYPHAMAMDMDKNIYSLAPDLENEFPKSQDIIDFFEKAISTEFHKENIIYRLFIICIDVSISKIIANKPQSVNAIEVRFIALNYRKVYYLEYEIIKNGELLIKDFLQ